MDVLAYFLQVDPRVLPEEKPVKSSPELGIDAPSQALVRTFPQLPVRSLRLGETLRETGASRDNE